MSRIQFGWSVASGPRDKDHRKTYLADIERGFDLVRGHFDSAWFIDHLQMDNRDVLEGWTALTYLAARHPDFQFGNAVLCQSFRNPALVAKMAATFQFMTGGRFILGIGAGWKEDEYRAYGYDFPGAGVRVDELEEALQIIEALWSDEQATVHGKYHQVTDAYCEPKPDPRPPIMIGGAKPRMLRVVARHADWWNVSWTGIQDYCRQVPECERACAEVGRDPRTLRRTWFGGCLCAPTDAAVQRLNTGGMSAANAFVGTPAQLIEQMGPFVELAACRRERFSPRTTGFPLESSPLEARFRSKSDPFAPL
jgi:alkanesulfonate monooxygenase SsuD/methylene tetrahydromethanopterin reductase-like flavin-dependent oxidoreductase (luciferase family)